MLKPKKDLSKSLVMIAFLMLLSATSISLVSCGKKIFPSGLEGNLNKDIKDYEKIVQYRKKVAQRHNRAKNQLEKQFSSERMKIIKEYEKSQEKMRKEHFARQTPEVQERMKNNLKEAAKFNQPNQTVCEKLVFWKKNKYHYGSR